MNSEHHQYIYTQCPRCYSITWSFLSASLLGAARTEPAPQAPPRPSPALPSQPRSPVSPPPERLPEARAAARKAAAGLHCPPPPLCSPLALSWRCPLSTAAVACSGRPRLDSDCGWPDPPLWPPDLHPWPLGMPGLRRRRGLPCCCGGGGLLLRPCCGAHRWRRGHRLRVMRALGCCSAFRVAAGVRSSASPVNGRVRGCRHGAVRRGCGRSWARSASAAAAGAASPPPWSPDLVATAAGLRIRCPSGRIRRPMGRSSR